MVLKITDICNMGCTHCLSDCTMTSHIKDLMDEDTLWHSIDFINKIKPFLLIVSGGEPCLHPDITKYIEILRNNIKYTFAITIVTNGEWVLQNKDTVKDILSKNKSNPYISWQITTDKRYYPRQIDRTDDIWNVDGVILCEEPIQKVYPLGRALKNNLGEDYKCSQCYNFRSIVNQNSSYDFIDAIKELESIQKFCHPCINTDGSLTLGESSLCKTVGTIYDSIYDLTEKTRKFSCKQCQWINEQLPDIYKQYIVFE